MAQFVRKGYLVKNQAKTFSWNSILDYSTAQNGSGTLILCKRNKENLKLSPDNVSLKDDISMKVEDLLKSSFTGFCITLLSQFDTTKDSYKVWIRLTLDDAILKELLRLFIVPKIWVEGIFSTNYKIQFKMSTCVLEASHTVEEFEGNGKIVELLDKFPLGSYSNLSFSVLLEWAELKHHPRKIVLEKLLSDKLLADFAIITGDGKEMSCHKSILAASSDVFHAMLTNGWQESQAGRIKMKELTEDVVNQLRPYLYEVDDFNPKQLKEEMAFELLMVAHQYNISGLEHLMMETLLDRAVDIFDMNLVLELYLFTEKVEGFNALCDKMVDLLRRKPKDLSSSSAYQALLKENPTEAANLTMKLLQLCQTNVTEQH